MLEETSGLGERRATTIVTLILFAEALWVFLFKHLPLDAALWTLQAELVAKHLAGHSNDGWTLIHYPASNIGAPLIAGLLSFIFSGEVVVRLLMTFGAIFLRGFGIVTLFRTLRVRDETIYFLIPVLVLSGIWFTGALPYLLGETLAVWVLVFFISQHHPRRLAYWTISFGLLAVSFASAPVFLMCAVVLFMIIVEQRQSVHLSHGWLGEPRAVLALLVPGFILVGLGLLGDEPLFRLSTSNFLPTGIGRILFLMTPAPNVLEATFRYGDILHGLLAVFFGVVLLACFARAYLLAIEEATWQSRALRPAGYILLVLALLGPLITTIGIDTSSGIVFAFVLILGGAYSGGPAIRRTPIDRLIHTGALITLIASVGINAYSVSAGSAAADDVLKSSRSLIRQERETARQDEHLDSVRIRFVLDSSETARHTSSLIAIFSYSSTAPLYLFTESDLLKEPWAFQPRGGIVQTSPLGTKAVSPTIPTQLGSADLYVDSTARILACLPKGSVVSSAFGPFELSLAEDGGTNIDRGEASYRLSIGKLKAGHPIQLAAKN
jgi:MFS family permease